MVNKLRGTINALAVKAPGFGDRRKEMLQDLAIVTGGTIVSADIGRTIEGVSLMIWGGFGEWWPSRRTRRS